MMTELTKALDPFRKRLSLSRAIYAGLFGLGLAALCGAIGAWWGVPFVNAILVMVMVPVICAAAAWLFPLTNQQVAVRIDSAAGLQDRAETAVEFARLSEPGTLHQLQIRDATSRLQNTSTISIAPKLLPTWCLIPILAYVASITWVLTASGYSSKAMASTDPAVQDIINMVDDFINDLTKDNDQEMTPEVLKQVECLRELAKQLREPGTDVAAATAALSKVQQQLEESSQSKDIARTDQGMKEIGAAMQSAKPLKSLGQALQQGAYGKAAKGLGDLRSKSFDARDIQAAQQDLKKAAEELDKQGLEELANPTKKMSQGVSGDEQQLRQGAEDLARQAREQDRRKRLNILTAKLQRFLTECKNTMHARNLMAQLGSSKASDKGNGKSAQEKSGITETLKDGKGKAPTAEELAKKLKEDPAFRAQAEKLMAKFKEEGITGGEEEEQSSTAEHEPGLSKRGSDVKRKFERRVESALEQAHVPLMYQEAVRRYFLRLPSLETTSADSEKK